MMLFKVIEIWRDETARDGAGQMACDEALLEVAERPVLRIFHWKGPAVSFGYAQSLGAVRAQFPGLPPVRRWTGGGIVEHRGDWTFSLVVPVAEPLAHERPAATYRLIHDSLAAALAEIGIASRRAASAELARGAACFVAPAPDDLMAAGGRKLCGGAQRRTRRGFLHQGSVQNAALPADFTGRFGETAEPFPHAARLDARIDALAAAKYGDPAWLAKIA